MSDIVATVCSNNNISSCVVLRGEIGPQGIPGPPYSLPFEARSVNLTSGNDTRFIPFNTTYTIVPIVVGNLVNNSGEPLFDFNISGIKTSGFSLNFGATLNSNNYIFDYFATTGPTQIGGTGLYLTITGGIQLSGVVNVTGQGGLLVYQQGQNIIFSGGAGSSSSVNFSSGNLIYVSKGVNATDNRAGISKYDFFQPFSTLTGAEFASNTGDCIYVFPGTYDDTNLGKDGLNYYFTPNTYINHNISDGDYVFGDGGNPKKFNVNGYLSISGFDDDNEGGSALFLFNNDSVVNFQAKSVIGNAIVLFELKTNNCFINIEEIKLIPGGDVVFEANGGIANINCKTIYSESAGSCLFISDNTKVNLSADEITSLHGECISVNSFNSTGIITVQKMYGGNNTECISFGGGNLIVNAQSIYTNNSDTGPIRIGAGIFSSTTSGNLSIIGAKIENTHNNMGCINFLSTGNYNIKLMNCELLSAAPICINGTGIIKPFSCYSNKDVDTNIQIIGGKLITDPNIS